MAQTILIIEDEEAIAWSLRRAFEKQGDQAFVCATAEDGLKLAAKHLPNVIFLDIRLPGMDGLTALARLRSAAPQASVIVMTAHGNLSTAVKAVEGGAFDYLAKPFNLDQALEAASRAAHVQPGGEISQETREQSNELIGQSLAIQNVFKRIALVAPTDANVLITGESGTGKELVARAIHTHSSRSSKPFLPVHVAAMNPNLVESELFGHVRGAFTGADRAREGLLVLADGGTIFLDEIADIPVEIQIKLLRVLERQEVIPVGGAVAQSVNVRIVSATHVDLNSAITEGRFRHDLFYRLNVFPIHLPALRDRVGDIKILAQAFLARIAPAATISPEAMSVLESRRWSGNVRELRNAIERAAIEARGGPIRPDHLPEITQNPKAQTIDEKLQSFVREWVRSRIKSLGKQEPTDLYQLLLEQTESTLVDEVIREVDGNRLVAGRWLGLARATVRKLIRKYNLGPDLEGDDESVQN